MKDWTTTTPELVRQGNVLEVDGQIVMALSFKVDPKANTVCFRTDHGYITVPRDSTVAVYR